MNLMFPLWQTGIFNCSAHCSAPVNAVVRCLSRYVLAKRNNPAIHEREDAVVTACEWRGSHEAPSESPEPPDFS
jgi:hypothetical protein